MKMIPEIPIGMQIGLNKSIWNCSGKRIVSDFEIPILYLKIQKEKKNCVINKHLSFNKTKITIHNFRHEI